MPLFAACFSSNVLFGLMTVFKRGSGEKERHRLILQLASQFVDNMQVWQLIREAVQQDIHARVRVASVHFLGQAQKDHPVTWQLIRDAATKDADSWVRSRACDLLLDRLYCSKLQRNLMHRPHSTGFSHDPKEPITSVCVTEMAQRFNLSVDEVRRQYEAIAAQLPIELILEWRKGH
jgi:hypothetical protein